MVAAFLQRNVVVTEAEIDNFEGFVSWVDQDVEGLNVSVHDSVGVQVVEALYQMVSTLKSCLM